jgi:hypothetical protein
MIELKKRIKKIGRGIERCEIKKIEIFLRN